MLLIAWLRRPQGEDEEANWEEDDEEDHDHKNRKEEWIDNSKPSSYLQYQSVHSACMTKDYQALWFTVLILKNVITKIMESSYMRQMP